MSARMSVSRNASITRRQFWAYNNARARPAHTHTHRQTHMLAIFVINRRRAAVRLRLMASMKISLQGSMRAHAAGFPQCRRPIIGDVLPVPLYRSWTVRVCMWVTLTHRLHYSRPTDCLWTDVDIRPLVYVTYALMLLLQKQLAETRRELHTVGLYSLRTAKAILWKLYYSYHCLISDDDSRVFCDL